MKVYATLTPAEVGLTKACNTCHGRFTLDRFYTAGPKITGDGLRVRRGVCVECVNRSRAGGKRVRPDDYRPRERARRRAVSRLVAAAPDLWNIILSDEYAKEGLL